MVEEKKEVEKEVVKKTVKAKKHVKKVDGTDAELSKLEGQQNVGPVSGGYDVFNTERDMAMDFAMRIHEKFDRLIKASILFGSQTKQTATESSDIDIGLILDDASVQWDLELIAWYREELGKLLAGVNYGKEIHVTTIKLTTFWNDLLHGDAVVINMLRYGEALIDSGGFFNPLKGLLQQGKIKSTHEAVYIALERSPMHLLRAKQAKLGAIDGIYWAIVDSSQAALMTVGKLPPSPEHIPGLLNDEFVQRRLLKEDSVKFAKEVYLLHRAIVHGNVREIAGSKIDELQIRADNFLSEMIRIINLVLDSAQPTQNQESKE